MFGWFVKDESGAVTVDYVVLTAAVTGLGIGVTGIIAPGLQNLSQQIMDELASTTISSELSANTVASNDFSTDAGAWSGASVTNVPGFGNVLGPIAGSQGLESVSATFDIPADSEKAVFEFDLLAFDSLDGEDAVLFIDGQEVGRVTATGGELTFNPVTATAGIGVEVDIVANGQPIGGMQTGPETSWNDGIAAVKISVDNPSETISLGVGSTADQPISDESWGLDNVIVSAVPATSSI